MKELFSVGVMLRKQIVLFLLIFVISSFFFELYSQTDQLKPTRQSSLEAFSKGNYEQAYVQFRELLVTYSKDPLYKYYSGVCLVRLGSNPAEATALLKQALQGAAVVKTLPSDAVFYLGRAQQMAGQFTDALASYDLFTDQAGKKAARELGVPEFVRQCTEGKGAVENANIKQIEPVKNIEKENLKNQSDSHLSLTETGPKNRVPSEKISLPAEYDVILDDAIKFQLKADSVNSLVLQQKQSIDKLTPSEKSTLRAKITVNESLASSYQRAADQKFTEAQNAMRQQQIISNPKDSVIPDVKVVKTDSSVKADSDFIKNSVQSLTSKIAKEEAKKPDSLNLPVPAVRKQVATFAIFKILAKPVTDPDEKIVIDPEVPEGLIYRIQTAVFRNYVSPAYFKGITPVFGFKLPGTDKTNYYAGMFRKSADANKALASVRGKGFKDAFVVAFIGNKPVSSDRAAILELEWGNKPFISMFKTAQEVATDTIPPALSFRIEALRAIKPPKDDVLEGIKKIAGTRGLDIQHLDDGSIVYLIGKFITFESAEEYADLLIRNGYRDARVVAFLGAKEVPLETAKKLFEDLE